MSETPKQIGRYAIETLIGEGGMAKVYLGHAQSASGFRRPVAIKLLQPHLRGDARFERMLISEATWGGKLHHDGLVPAYELGLHEGSYFVCMDYISGMTLRDFRAAVVISADAAVFFVTRLAAVLDYVHNYTDEHKRIGLLHRDITPSNVMVSKAGQVKLVDFGIAKATALSSSTQGNLLKGTYAYMSPEQIGGLSLDARSDIFSLGALFFELLTGQRAFDGETVHETMRCVRDCQWSWPADAPSDQHREVVVQCLQADPALRFESAAAMFAALRALPCDYDQLRLRKEWPTPISDL